MRAQTFAIFTAKSPLWKFEDNIFTHLRRQVHEILALKLLVEDELVDFQRQIEVIETTAAPEAYRRAELAGDK